MCNFISFYTHKHKIYRRSILKMKNNFYEISLDNVFLYKVYTLNKTKKNHNNPSINQPIITKRRRRKQRKTKKHLIEEINIILYLIFCKLMKYYEYIQLEKRNNQALTVITYGLYFSILSFITKNLYQPVPF